MSKTDHSRIERHHSGHAARKRGYNRKIRHIVKSAILAGKEAPIQLADFEAPGFCCGNHSSDWRY